MHYNDIHSLFENISINIEDLKYKYLFKKIGDKEEAIDNSNLSKDEKDKLIVNLKNDLNKEINNYVDKYIELYTKAKTYTEKDIERAYDYVEKFMNDHPGEFPDKQARPKMKYLSKGEKAQRKKLSDSFRKTYVEAVANNSFIMKYVDTVVGKTLFDRPVQTLLFSPNVSDLETTVHNYELLKNKTNENYQERKNLLETKLKSYIGLMKELQYSYTDSEFVEKFKDRLPEIFQLTELQANNIPQILEHFGVEIDPALKEEWKDLNGAFVGAGSFINRFGMIANPEYAEVNIDTIPLFMHYAEEVMGYDEFTKDMNMFKNVTSITKKEDFDKLYNGLKDGTKTEDDLNYEIIPAQHIYQSADYTTYDFYNKDSTKLFLQNEIKNETKFKFEDLTYKDLNGNEIPKDNVVDKLYENKAVQAFDKDGNIVMHMGYNYVDKAWGTIKANNYRSIDLNLTSIDEAQSEFEELLNEVNNTTHFYMSSSPQFRDFRTALKDLVEYEYENNEEFLEQIEEVKNLAQAYMSMKEKPDAKITKRTLPRMDACDKVLNACINTMIETKQFKVAELKEVVKEEPLDNSSINNVVEQVNVELNEKEFEFVETSEQNINNIDAVSVNEEVLDKEL